MIQSHPDRKSLRLQGYNYRKNGCYFVTICTHHREEYLGTIGNGKLFLSEIGIIAEHCWYYIPSHFPFIVLDYFVIMPNHIHGIIVIEHDEHGIVVNKNWDGDVVGNKNLCSLHRQNEPWQKKVAHSLSSVIRGFKIGVTKWCRNNDHNNFCWQKSFHDTIIRDEGSLNHVREYIQNNPMLWNEDIENKITFNHLGGNSPQVLLSTPKAYYAVGRYRKE